MQTLGANAISDSLFSKVLGARAIEEAASRAQAGRSNIARRKSLEILDLSQRNAIVAGVKGKLGEALLTQLLASEYHGVSALVTHPVQMGFQKLCTVTLNELRASHLPLDAYLCLSHADDTFGRSYYGRDAPFSELSLENLLAIANRLYEHGVKRLILLSPLSGWQQLSQTARGISGELESQLISMAFESVLILRPASQEVGPKDAGLLQGFANSYLNIFRLMLPKGTQVMRADQLAKASIRANQKCSPGVKVLTNEHLTDYVSP